MVALCCCGSSTCTDASNLCPPAFAHPAKVVRHTPYFLQAVFGVSLTSSSERNERNRKKKQKSSLKKHKQFKKRKSLFSGLLRKKFGMTTYFLKFLRFFKFQPADNRLFEELIQIVNLKSTSQVSKFSNRPQTLNFQRGFFCSRTPVAQCLKSQD